MLPVLDLVAHHLVGQAGELAVVIAVVGHLVALLVHPLHQVRVPGGTLAYHKEGGLGPPRLQAVQEPGSMGPGAVVVGDGKEFLPHRIGGDAKQGAQQEDREEKSQNSLHNVRTSRVDLPLSYHSRQILTTSGGKRNPPSPKARRVLPSLFFQQVKILLPLPFWDIQNHHSLGSRYMDVFHQALDGG